MTVGLLVGVQQSFKLRATGDTPSGAVRARFSGATGRGGDGRQPWARSLPRGGPEELAGASKPRRGAAARWPSSIRGRRDALPRGLGKARAGGGSCWPCGWGWSAGSPGVGPGRGAQVGGREMPCSVGEQPSVPPRASPWSPWPNLQRGGRRVAAGGQALRRGRVAEDQHQRGRRAGDYHLRRPPAYACARHRLPVPATTRDLPRQVWRAAFACRRLAPACARAGLESRRRPPAPAPAWRAAAAEKRIELVGFVFGAESVVWPGPYPFVHRGNSVNTEIQYACNTCRWVQGRWIRP